MPEPSEVHCHDASLAAREPLYGTAAADTDLWVVLEVATPWGPKGLDDSALPAAVVARLNAFLAAQPRARVQLIRKPERHASAPTLYLGHSGEQGANVQRLTLDNHEALLTLDLEAFARGETLPLATPVVEPVYLVCVHGKRDRCCAQYGMPVYSALSALAPEHTWQTTHLGGHRFAATMLVLPHGVSYGRVLEHEAAAIVSASARAELYDLERMRGRTSYAPAVQAADYWLRKQDAQVRLSAFTFESSEPVEAGQRVWFRDDLGARHSVDVAKQPLASIPASCGAAPKSVDEFVTLRATGRP